jgi:nickel-dependent lactate racemase
MVFFEKGSIETVLSDNDIRSGLYEALHKVGEKKRVLAVPPDFTRFHSQAGKLTRYAWEYYSQSITDILPATGTHFPMTSEEIEIMFGNVPRTLFQKHDWRAGLTTLGIVPSSFVSEISEGKITYDIPLPIDTLIAGGTHDLILSIGQVVPHEVIGMANYNKNIFVGTGGSDVINKTHFLGAVYGMERIMGRADTPVRAVLNYGSEHFTKHLPIVYVLTVIGRDDHGNLVMRGLFIGDDSECFRKAADLSLQVNFQLLDEPLHKVIVYLDPSEFKSTWLGNKSIYRTRMAIADGGELIVLAPGLAEFGEDAGIDSLIRKYGYIGTPHILDLVKTEHELQNNLSAAAHLIHGSSEDRFSITYCPGKISRKEIESVNFHYADLRTMVEKYNPGKLHDGFNTLPDGETIFYISNPALGLWAYKGRIG